MRANEGKKKAVQTHVSAGDDGSMAARGALDRVMTENRSLPEQLNLKDHTAGISPLSPPSLTLGLWTAGIHLLQS